MPSPSTVKTKSPVLLVIIVLFFLFLLAGIAGLYFAKSFNLPVSLPGALSGLVGAPGAMPRATENDFSFIEDPVLRKHMAAQANQAAFRVKSRDAVSAKGFNQIFEVELRGDEMAYANWTETNGKKSGELMSIGKTTFVKDYKDNTWWRQTDKPEAKPTGGDQPAIEPTDFKKEYEELKSKPPKFEKLGEEACGTLTCYKYKEVDEQTPEASRIFWFDTKQYLLRKEESGYGEWRALTDYEYDGVSVKAPGPMKDVPEGKNIYEYMTIDPSMYSPSGKSSASVRPPEDSSDNPFEYTPPADTAPAEEP